MRRKLALVFVGVMLAATPVWAHLGGTGSVDQVARITREGNKLVIVFELDMAEFPSQELRKKFDRMRDLRIDANEEKRGLRTLSREVQRGLVLALNGHPLRMKLKGRPVLETVDRTTGAVPLKVRFRFEAVLPDGFNGGTFTFKNNLYADRIGFVRAHLDPGEGFIARGDEKVAAEVEKFEQLNAIIVDGKVKELPRGKTPPRIKEMVWEVLAGEEPSPQPGEKEAETPAPEEAKAPAAEEATTPVFSDKASRTFWEFFQDFNQLSTWVIFGFIGLAFVYGMSHALMPGHGKAITAAFLVGNRGTIKDAILLGVTVTCTHTVAVFALGLAAEVATYTIRRDRVIWWLELVSAFLIIGLGLFIFLRHLVALARGTEAGHGHVHFVGGHHHHHHDHDHEHSHAHDHAHEKGERPGLWQIIYLGITGGMIPCPTGLVIVSVSFQAHLLGFGLFLAAVFSLGMACVLVAIGILTVKGFHVAERYGSRRAIMVFRVMPVLSGGFITLLGLVFLGTTMGWLAWDLFG